MSKAADSTPSAATHTPSVVDDILAEYQGLEAQLADPELHNDQKAARRVGKRFQELQPIIQTHNALIQAREDH